MDFTTDESVRTVVVFYIFMISVFVIVGTALFSFWIWMLVDCLKYERSQGNDKIIWTLVIVFTTWIGAVIYFFARRKGRKRIQDSPCIESPQIRS